MDVIYTEENNSFTLIDDNFEIKIFFAAADLYIVMQNYYDNNVITIDPSKKIYVLLKSLFSCLKLYDDEKNPTLVDNTFTWISEDYGEYKDANRMTITKEGYNFIIRFYKNPSKLLSINNVCPICFCQSGSQHEEIANLFAATFNREVAEKKSDLNYCYKKKK